MHSIFHTLTAATLAVGALAGFVGSVAAQDAFPVTIDHAFGQTTIEAKPERVVTIGWMSLDAALVLGVAPVGAPDVSSWGGDETGFYPWVSAEIAELGAELPTKIDTNDGIPFEDVLALEPDVILARYSGLTQEEYDRLSSIAPVVAYAERPWAGDWRDITRTTGKALGQSERAEELITETEALITAEREAHPEFNGRTFVFAGNVGANIDQLPIYVSTDSRVQLMQDLGLTLAPGAAALPTDQGFNQPVSLENLDSVDADIFIAWHPDQAGADYVTSNDLLSRFRPVAEGRFIGMVDRSFAMATSAPSPLSIPYALDTLVPRIADVLK